MKTDKQRIDALTNEVKEKTETIHTLLEIIESLKAKELGVTEDKFMDIFEQIVLLFSKLGEKNRDLHIRMVNLLRARHGITITDLEQ